MSLPPDEAEAIELTVRYSYDVDFEDSNEAASHALLGSETTLVDESNVDPAMKRKWITPIPKLQIMTLCAVRLVDPIRYGIRN